ncbi:hypothetical protein D3C83_201800 [compost metagenome]
MFLEATDIEPVAGKLGRETADFRIVKHPLRLGLEYVRLVEIARFRVREQLLVRHT